LTWLVGIAAFVVFILLILFVFPEEWHDVLLDEQNFWVFVVLIFIGIMGLIYAIKWLISRK
jgi:hypothetical protein